MFSERSKRGSQFKAVNFTQSDLSLAPSVESTAAARNRFWVSQAVAELVAVHDLGTRNNTGLCRFVAEFSDVNFSSIARRADRDANSEGGGHVAVWVAVQVAGTHMQRICA